MSDVVVVGGGFGGTTVARELERLLAKRDVRVTLVAPESSMLCTPLLSLVAAGVLDARHAMIPLSPQLSRTTLVLGSAVGVDLDGRRVEVATRTGEVRTLPWDQLVLAPGSVTRLPATPGVAETAFGLKTLNEVSAVRDHVLEQLELANATSDAEERRRRTTFVVVGAGYAGTEMTAELHSMTQRALEQYPNLRDGGTRWLLLQHGPRILPELSTSLSARADEVLRGRGVEVRTGTSVEDADATGVWLTSGERVATSTLVWSAGVAPHPWVAELGLAADDRGRLLVDEHLHVHDHPDVSAVGDAAAVVDPVGGEPVPPTADQAADQGRAAARNVAAALGVGRPRPYAVRSGRALVVNLADRTGVGAVAGVPVAGTLGWAATVLDRVVHLPRGHRLRVALGWTLGDGAAPDVAELGQIGSHDPHAVAEPGQAGHRELQAARDR